MEINHRMRDGEIEFWPGMLTHFRVMFYDGFVFPPPLVSRSSYPSIQSEVATAVSNAHRPCVEMFKTQEKLDISVN